MSNPRSGKPKAGAGQPEGRAKSPNRDNPNTGGKNTTGGKPPKAK